MVNPLFFRTLHCQRQKHRAVALYGATLAQKMRAAEIRGAQNRYQKFSF